MPDDALGRAVRDPLRPARVFAAAFALGAVAFLVAAVVVAATALSAEREVVARSDGGSSLVLPDSPRPDLDLYGVDTAGGRPPGRVGCEPVGGGPGVRNNVTPGTFELDGRTLHLVGHVRSGWDDGESVTCPGLVEVVAVAGGGPRVRLALAGMLLVGAVIATVLAVVGFRSRRSRGGSGGAPARS